MNFFKKVKLRRLQEAITSNGKPLSPNPENPKKEDDLEIPDFSKVGDIEPSKDTNSAQAPQPTTTPEANPEGNQPQDNPEAEDPNAEGENPEGEEQPQDDDGLGDMSEEQPQDEAPADDVTPGADDELKQAEVDLFSKLTPAQIQVKNTELKSQFVKTYISITNAIERLSKVDRKEYTIKPLNFVIKKMIELKDLTKEALVINFSNKSYVENQIVLQRIMAVYLNFINIIEELKLDMENEQKTPTKFSFIKKKYIGKR